VQQYTLAIQSGERGVGLTVHVMEPRTPPPFVTPAGFQESQYRSY